MRRTKESSFETSSSATACGVETRSDESVGSRGEAGDCGIRSGRSVSSNEMCSSEVPVWSGVVSDGACNQHEVAHLAGCR